MHSRSGDGAEDTDPGLAAAVSYKYYRQFHSSAVSRPVSRNRISAISLYRRHKIAFDRIARVFAARNLELDPYIKFYADTLGRVEDDIDTGLADPNTLSLYAGHVSKIKKMKDIMTWFDKSVSNLADFCIAEHVGAVDGFRLLLKNRLLSSWYVTGRLSKYWLAAIPGFGAAVERLDHFSKLELSELAERYDLYNTEVNSASMYCRNIKANPMKAVDSLIEKRVFEQRAGDSLEK